MTDEQIALEHELVNTDHTAHLYCVPRSRVLAALAAARQDERERCVRKIQAVYNDAAMDQPDSQYMLGLQNAISALKEGRE